MSGLDTAVSRVIALLGEFSAASQAFEYAAVPSNQNTMVIPPHSARARLIAAIRTAEMVAGGNESKPLEALFELITAQDGKTANQRGVVFEGVSNVLVSWRKGKLAADAAADAIKFPKSLKGPSAD